MASVPLYTAERPENESNFYTSGTSNEQLTIYVFPHQTVYTHSNHVMQLSDKLSVEQLPCIQLPFAFDGTQPSFFLDSLVKCCTTCFLWLCECSLFGISNTVSMSEERSNFFNTRLVINNNHFTAKHDESAIPYICLSPSLHISSPHSFGRRNFSSPTADSSSISGSLSRKILSINLSAQHDSSLVINIVNLFAYIINDTSMYEQQQSAQSLSTEELMLDFQSPILPYKLQTAANYSNESNDRLLSSLERLLSFSSLTRFRANRVAENNNSNQPAIGDLVSRRTSARAAYRKKMSKRMARERQRTPYCCCCCHVLRYLLLLIALALFPAIFVLVLMERVLESLSFENSLPLSNTLCLVQLQCPHYRRQSATKKTKKGRRRRRIVEDDTIVFLESNGDIYHKLLAEHEKFYVRGECVIAFDAQLQSVRVCNYGESGANLREYRCKGDFVEFVGPGNIWYGCGKQDLLSNSYKLDSLLFCDNVKYAQPHYVPNLEEVQQQPANNENGNANGNGRAVGNYSNGRFGIIQSFELRSRYKVQCVEKCLVLSTLALLLLTILLLAVTFDARLQPNFITLIFNKLQQFLQPFNNFG
mmetsp:Transcript_44634/g.71430  ORF Transcript_44634/g.71430 Transcript_44634/m.71430 type:complete len:589 (+) Transcript_44634:41-1807(+)|eukprot:CAMPEP_0197057924 /NCGR_PEP_ID=MMETSP1384-20130603/102270_1 /TAXON_ID=29189 /ORGANISM="Ammonia sp." /LENGTH=588 /DNA_ID=CAMNT_0042492493 /DNA_START=21 /DNA_END=1787 /DNA_ORIENTATION=+